MATFSETKTRLFWSFFLDSKIFCKAQQNVKSVNRLLVVNWRLCGCQGSKVYLFHIQTTRINYILSNKDKKHKNTCFIGNTSFSCVSAVLVYKYISICI